MATNAAAADAQVPLTNGAEPPSPPPPAYGGETEELALVQVVRLFLRHWRLICGMALAAGFSAALYLALFVPRTYEASATLVIVSPPLSSELKPPTLTVQGYQKLLESDAVLAETKRRLAQQGVLAERETPHVGGNVETRIFVAAKSETTSLAPMLQAIGRGKSAEQAAAIVNTWAQVFLGRTHELMTGTTSAAVQFIDAQYPQVQDQLAQAETERDSTANEFQKRYDGLAISWDEKLAAFQNESASLVAAFQDETAKLVAAFQDETANLVATFQNETADLVAAFQDETTKLVATFQNETADLVAADQTETTRLVEEFTSQRNLDTREAQLQSLRDAYAELHSEQARVSTLLQQKQLQLDTTRQQLAQAPQYLTLEKAVSDDALWQALALQKNQKMDWKALQGRSLLTQEVNPVYTELSSRLAQVEMKVNTLAPRGMQLSQELARMSATIQELDTAFNADKAEQEKLRQEREAGLAKLKTQREAELTVLTRERDLKQSALTKERETQFASFSRERDLKQNALTRERDLKQSALTKERENQLAGLTRQQKQELDAIGRERDNRLAQLDRQIARLKELHGELAKNYNQATLAKAQQEVEDVRLGAAAVPPDRPAPRGLVPIRITLQL
jgi:capsular polysaccharide biosynthesis protein